MSKFKWYTRVTLVFYASWENFMSKKKMILVTIQVSELLLIWKNGIEHS